MTRKSYERTQPREVYLNQRFLERKIRENLLSNRLNRPFVDEVRLIGSLASEQFGVFYEPELKHLHHPKYASDVDLLITGDEAYPVPTEWGEGRPFIFFDVYNLGTLSDIKGVRNNVHEIEAWVYLPSQADQPPRLTENILEKMRMEQDPRLDFKTRKEWLNWQLKNHRNRIWYQK